MIGQVILDAGPLVALLNRRDRHHSWARDQWARISPPLIACEAVLAEACFLVRRFPDGQQAVLDLARRGVLDLSYRLAEDADAVSRLMGKYRDVPMSLADACLVRLAERHTDGVVLTLDNDFSIYRKHGRKVIPALTPSAGYD
ncbi:MAG: PIN domain-containing protein [Gammaproteobacteria bacterium]|nr:PIN domain-containing protein [Gammaproteobacteria bacterium]